MTDFPSEFKTELYAKNIDSWKKVYNVYTYELVQLIRLLLVFQDIKMTAPGQRKAAAKSLFNWKLNLNLSKLNVFKLGTKGSPTKKKKLNRQRINSPITPKDARPLLETEQSQISQDRQELEFEGILKSLVSILEYDRTYPESRKQLIEIKKSKSFIFSLWNRKLYVLIEREEVKKGSMNKLIKGFAGALISNTKGMLNVFGIASSEEKKKTSKTKSVFEVLSDDITGNGNLLSK